MSEPKFTPGPWLVDSLAGSDPYEDPDIPFVEIGGVRWQPHAVEVPCAFQQRYDAMLISAAPELYRELEELVSLVQNSDSTYWEGVNPDEVVETALAALAKARGE